VVEWAAVDLAAARLSFDWAASQREMLPLVNTLMMPGAVLVAGLATLALGGRRRLSRSLRDQSARGWAAFGTTVLSLAITVALSFELERVLTSTGRPGGETIRTLLLGLTVLWLLMTAGTTEFNLRLFMRRGRAGPSGIAIVGGVCVLLITAKYVLVDTLLFNLASPVGPAYPFLTVESVVGFLVIGVLLAGWRRFSADGPNHAEKIATALGAAALVLGAWLGLLEVDRAVNTVGGGSFAFQVCISLWLGTYAAACVGAGFFTRRAALRWFGLVLLGLVLLKVLLLDLGSLGKGWRTLSFVATGVLLLLVSVLYGKFSPRNDAEAGEG
ncbi:MAG: DUF2339 domain-containing protein, partial [Planctomycetota bacterium]